MLKKIKKVPLRIIKNNAGDIIKYLEKKNKYFNKFGEVYFSKIKKGHIKGWNLHKRYTCNIFVIKGEMEFLICNNSKKEKIKKIKLSLNKNNNLIIKPNNWFSFSSSSKKKEAIFLNLTDGFHSLNEILKKPINKIKS